MDLKKLMKSVGHGEKGFTLIELLVVVAILGVIAAVVVLNIGSFIGSGAVESANTEAHQVVTAAIAYMQAANQMTLADTTVGPADGNTAVEDYMLNPGRMQATYTLDSSGKITGATPIADSKWSDLTWNATQGAWVETT